MDFLWSDASGLQVDAYEESDVQERAAEVFHHTLPRLPATPLPDLP